MNKIEFIVPKVTQERADAYLNRAMAEIYEILDNYVRDHDLSVSDMFYALEEYRHMLIENSKVLPYFREGGPLREQRPVGD